MKTKEVENTSDYKDKEEQIIDQEPKFDKEKKQNYMLMIQ